MFMSRKHVQLWLMDNVLDLFKYRLFNMHELMRLTGLQENIISNSII